MAPKHRKMSLPRSYFPAPFIDHPKSREIFTECSNIFSMDVLASDNSHQATEYDSAYRTLPQKTNGKSANWHLCAQEPSLPISPPNEGELNNKHLGNYAM